jgi:ribosome-associated translation inhibitor RaiA
LAEYDPCSLRWIKSAGNIRAWTGVRAIEEKLYASAVANHLPPHGSLACGRGGIRERAEALERFFGRIISGRVVVECCHPHGQQGRLYHVRVDLKIPGHEIVVGRDPGAHEDIHVAVRAAFDAVRRQLEEQARMSRAG